MALKAIAASCGSTDSTGRMISRTYRGRLPLLSLCRCRHEDRALDVNEIGAGMSSKDLATFCNPFWAENFPDPFVLKVRGRYYAYATEYEKLPPLAPDEKVFPIL